MYGTCGSLPLQQHIAEILEVSTESEDDEDQFTREDNENQDIDLLIKAAAWLREEFDL